MLFLMILSAAGIFLNSYAMYIGLQNWNYEHDYEDDKNTRWDNLYDHRLDKEEARIQKKLDRLFKDLGDWK